MYLCFLRDVFDFGFMLCMFMREGFFGLFVFVVFEGLIFMNSFFRILGFFGLVFIKEVLSYKKINYFKRRYWC